MQGLRKFDFDCFDAEEEVQCRAHPLIQPMEDVFSGDLVCPQCSVVLVERIVHATDAWRGKVMSGAIKRKRRAPSPEPEPALLAPPAPPSPSSCGSSTPRGSDSNTGITRVCARAIYATEPAYSPTYSQTYSQAYSPPHYSAVSADFPGASVDHSIHYDQARLTAGKLDLVRCKQALTRIADKLNLSKHLRRRSLTIFKRIHECSLMCVYSLETRIAASCYFACREQYKLSVLQSTCAKDGKDNAAKACCDALYQQMMDAFDLHFSMRRNTDFLSLICAGLNLPTRVELTSWAIAANAKDINDLDGRSPLSIASAAVFVASYTDAREYIRDAEEVAAIAGVVPRTIMAIYEIMFKNLDLLLPSGLDPKMIMWPNM